MSELRQTKKKIAATSFVNKTRSMFPSDISGDAKFIEASFVYLSFPIDHFIWYIQVTKIGTIWR